METYIVSFGNSSEYRLDLPEGDISALADIKNSVTDYISRKFPALSDKRFYEKMTVVKVEPADVARYAGYKAFDSDSISEIKKVLATEIRDDQDVDMLNSNAAFGTH